MSTLKAVAAIESPNDFEMNEVENAGCEIQRKTLALLYRKKLGTNSQ